MIVMIIILVVIITACVFMWSDYYSKKTLVYVLKPATTILIILLAIVQNPGDYNIYKIIIILGLCISLAGDIFLMLPNDKFILGLGSFFIAHVFYIIAFTVGANSFYDIIFSIPAVLFAMVFLWFIIPKTGRLKVPVIVYAIILTIFLWQATGRYFVIDSNSAILSLCGAVLFIISDSVLGYSRFVKERKTDTITIHATYWSAQLLLALSI